MLDTVLTLQNPHWQGKPYSGLFNREQLPFLLKKLALKEIQVLFIRPWIPVSSRSVRSKIIF